MAIRPNVIVSQLLWIVSVLRCSSSYTLAQEEGERGIGKNLLIKSIPAVPGYQSDIYEVYLEPYLYGLTKSSDGDLHGSRTQKKLGGLRPALKALAVLQGEGEAAVKGELVFTQWDPNGPVAVEGNVTGLAAGRHGVHIHHTGDLRDGCKSTGRHYNPYLHRHGGPRDPIRHLGDLGNVIAGDDGAVNIKIVDHLISLIGPRSVVGRSIVISAKEDDLGRSGTEDSALNGSSGEGVACGVIGFL